MITVGSKVTLKKDYTGYFRERMGQEMTVMQVFDGNQYDRTKRVTVEEIDEIHLIGVHNFNEVKDEK